MHGASPARRVRRALCVRAVRARGVRPRCDFSGYLTAARELGRARAPVCAPVAAAAATAALNLTRARARAQITNMFTEHSELLVPTVGAIPASSTLRRAIVAVTCVCARAAT